MRGRMRISNPDQYKVDVPEGSSGDWEVRKFTVTEEEQENQMLRALMSGTGRFTPPGDYTGLYRNGQVIMSDTPDEISDLKPLATEAHGDIVIFGVGLGVAINVAMANDDVDHVTAVDNSPDVLKLVQAHYRDKYEERLAIHQDDAWDFTTIKYGQTVDLEWDYAWFDIWDDLALDHLDDFEKLRKKYRKNFRDMGFWGEQFLLHMDRRRGNW